MCYLLLKQVKMYTCLQFYNDDWFIHLAVWLLYAVCAVSLVNEYIMLAIVLALMLVAN